MTFGVITSITVKGACHLRKIFTLRRSICEFDPHLMDDQIQTEKTRMIMPKPICLPKEYSESVEISYNTVMRHLNYDEEMEDEENYESDNFNRKSCQNGEMGDLITINNKGQNIVDFNEAKSPNVSSFKTKNNPGISQSKTTTTGSVNLYGAKDCSFSKASRSTNQTGLTGVTGSKQGTDSSGNKGDTQSTMNHTANNSKNNRSNSRKQQKVDKDSKNNSQVRKKNQPIANIGDFSDTENNFEGKKTPNNKKPNIPSGTTSTKDTSNMTSASNSKGQKINSNKDTRQTPTGKDKPKVPVPKPNSKDARQNSVKSKNPQLQLKKDQVKKGVCPNKVKLTDRDDQANSNDKDFGLQISSSNDKNQLSTRDGSTINVLTNAYNPPSNSTLATRLGTKSTKASSKNSSENNTKKNQHKFSPNNENPNNNGTSTISKQNMIMRQMEKQKRDNFADIEEKNNIEMGNKVASFVEEVKHRVYENVNNLQDNNPYKPSKKNYDEKV